MQFDNQKTTIRSFLRKMLVTIIFGVAIIAVMMLKFFNKPFYGLERYTIVLILLGLYIGIMVFTYSLKRNYIYFNDDGEAIILRYYPIRPIARKKSAIEIPKTSLVKFEIRKSFFGLKKTLFLYQKVKNKVARYPAIGLTALNKKELESISTQLSKYVKR
ncbi:MAG: hypothetical protein ISS19_07235 [Bacteroidales bacterium]|nr:hypothetical protein [Bacteroidales bacterium]